MPTDPIEDILFEEEQRDEWKKRLEQLYKSRRERLGRLNAALRMLSGLTPREGQALSTTSHAEFANEQMAVRRVLQDNGQTQSIEKVWQSVSNTCDRNLDVAAILLAEKGEQGILSRLQQIGRLSPQRDPHDPRHVSQSEVFRHFRGLLGHVVRLEDFPENTECGELEMKLSPFGVPPSPPVPELPAEAGVDFCAPGGATDTGEPTTDSQETCLRAKGKSGPQFDRWAFGLEAEGIWHLFRRVYESGRPHWRHQRKIQGLSRGKLQQIMEKLAEGEGFVSRKDLATLIFRAPRQEGSKYKGQVLAPLSRLRAVIRTNVDGSTPKANPLPWDECHVGWRAKIEIGYAIQEESRLEFRKHSAMQP